MDKHWRYPIFILGLTLLTLPLCGTCLSESQKLPIQEHQDAITIANQVSGFDKLPNFSDVIITVQRVVIEKDDTVLYKWIEGRSFWKVSYANVVLPTTTLGKTLRNINAFDVFVDVETGQVPKLVSQWLPNSRYKEAIHSYQEKMKGTFLSLRQEKQQYTVPEVLPKMNFLDLYNNGLTDLDDEHIEVVYMYDLDDRGVEHLSVPTLFINRYGRQIYGSAPVRPTKAYRILPDGSPAPVHSTQAHPVIPYDFITCERAWINAETGHSFQRQGGDVIKLVPE